MEKNWYEQVRLRANNVRKGTIQFHFVVSSSSQAVLIYNAHCRTVALQTFQLFLPHSASYMDTFLNWAIRDREISVKGMIKIAGSKFLV